MKFSIFASGQSWLAVVLFFLSGIAATASPYGATGRQAHFQQPDGSMITVLMRGDEFRARTETADGYTVVFDEPTQAYWYATLSADGNALQKTAYQVGQVNPAAAALKPHLDVPLAERRRQALERRQEVTSRMSWETSRRNHRLRLQEAVLAKTLPAAGGESPAGSNAPKMVGTDHPVGEYTGLTILVNFSDLTTQPFTWQQVDNFCNQDGYSEFGNSGSVRDFYRDQSNGKLLYRNLVTAYVTVSHPKNYYHYSDYPTNRTFRDCGSAAQLLLKDALTALQATGFDFSTLTTDASGYVLATNLLFAGGNSGVWARGLWPCQDSLSAGREVGASIYIRDFQMSDMGSALDIGTFCHENGHLLCGFNDMYDYGYDGFASSGLGNHCVMAGGCNLNGGKTPAGLDGALKYRAGWITPTEIGAGDFLTTALAADGMAALLYRNPAAATEYFIIENRQKTGWNSAIPDAGLAIWHVDEAQSGNEYQAMTLSRHFEISLEQADGRFDLEHGTNDGDINDYFKQGTAVLFNDTTTPAAKWWNGVASKLKLSAISAAQATMTLTVGEAGGFSLSKTALSVKENGGTGTFTVVLSSPPQAAVVLAVASSSTDEVTVDPATLTFTADDWNVPQTVTVTGVDDSKVASDSATVTASVVVADSDPAWATTPNQTVAITCINDEIVAIVPSTTALTINENGGTGTFTAALSMRPAGNVVLQVRSSSSGEATASPSTLLFTPDNWDIPQAVLVTGVNDFQPSTDTANIILSVVVASSSGEWSTAANQTVVVTCTNDDQAGFALSRSTLTVAENGGTGTFAAVLTAKPSSSVVLSVASANTGEATVSVATLTFTALNWNLPQTVTVRGINDYRAATDSTTVRVVVDSLRSDLRWNQAPAQTITITCANDDLPRFSLSKTSLTVAENGGIGSFTAVLSVQPGADVTLTVASSSTHDITVVPSSITFTPTNWNQPRTIVVTGVNDYRVATDLAKVTVAVDPRSGSLWSTVAARSVLVTCTNDDVAGVLVGVPSGSTSEAGGTATVTMVLRAQPSATVTIPISSSDSTEGTVAPGSVVFTPDNWNVPQTITATGVDDNTVDGSIAYRIITGTTVSTDLKFNGINPADATLVNLDDDLPGFVISQTMLEVGENAGTATFTAVLSKQPAGSVVLAVSSSSTAEATVSTSSISFSTTNWNIPRLVTVKGVNDYKPSTDSATIRVGINISSSNRLWAAVPAQTIAVTCVNNDIPAFTLSKTALAVGEAGGTGTFTAVLTAQPAATVVLAISSADTAEATVSPATLTFTPSSWRTAQTITVRGVNDFQTTTDTTTISAAISPATLDPRWTPAPAKSVLVTCINND
jgi:M6 family metalloprotease-like protein